MGQDEVLNWFIDRRKKGNHKFFAPIEVMKDCGISGDTRRKINKLYAYGFLEVEKETFWKRGYRVKNEHVYRSNI